MHGFDWYGRAVNVAARLAGEARPGEALVSSDSLSAASARLTRWPGTRRELALRGLERPIIAWQLS
jgi:class 3 adenylate cyclase